MVSLLFFCFDAEGCEREFCSEDEDGEVLASFGVGVVLNGVFCGDDAGSVVSASSVGDVVSEVIVKVGGEILLFNQLVLQGEDEILRLRAE